MDEQSQESLHEASVPADDKDSYRNRTLHHPEVDDRYLSYAHESDAFCLFLTGTQYDSPDDLND